MNVNQFKEVHNIFLHMIFSLGSRNLEILKQYWILSYEHITLNLIDMAEKFFVTNYERDELITIIREAFGAELTDLLALFSTFSNSPKLLVFSWWTCK